MPAGLISRRLAATSWLLMAWGLLWLTGCASVATEPGRYGVAEGAGDPATTPYEKLDQEVVPVFFAQPEQKVPYERMLAC